VLSIITGLPGNGKTLYTLDLVSKYQAAQLESEKKTDPEAKARPIYQNGIPELTWQWETLEHVERWHELPTGAIIVIDESQRHFPQMSSSAKRPEHYSRFDMHRHQGHDIFLLTQDSNLIDTNVRAMAGRHIHLVRPFGMEYANVYDWPQVHNTRGKDVSKDTSALKSKWMFNKELYAVYKSAEAHTVKRQLPYKKLAILAFTLIAPVVLMLLALDKVRGPANDHPEIVQGGVDDQSERTATASPMALPSVSGNGKRSMYTDLSAFQPRIPDVPSSASVYDGLTTAQDAPRVSGCSHLEYDDFEECNCTDQQGSTIDVSLQFCKTYIKKGAFDPTLSARFNPKNRL